ncbi:MAG: D-arabinono-1,4-lactone oxidase [Ilumatobacteraceae bacterium]
MATVRRGVWSNWAGNQSIRPEGFDRPTNEDQLASLVSSARRVRAVGTGHSFTGAALTDGRLVSMDDLRRLVAVDREAGTVTVEAGITIADLNELLQALGLALTNLGDIAYQTISGAISTSTHGTGARFTGLAGQVRALRLVDGTGGIHHIVDPDQVRLATVGVGALGIVTRYTLAVVPAFRLRAEEGAGRLDDLLDELDRHVDENDHFEFFWLPHTPWALTKRNRRTDDEPDQPSARDRARLWWSKTFIENIGFGILCELGNRRPSLIPRLATALPSSGTSVRTSDSHRIFASARLVRFLEMEWAIPRSECATALRRLRSMIHDEGHLVSFPVEVRFTAADDVALSTASGRDTAYVAVHMHKRMPSSDTERYFGSVERIMRDLGGRPHWGKMHNMGADDLAPLYPRWNEFLELRERMDPRRAFANDYTDRVFGR